MSESKSHNPKLVRVDRKDAPDYLRLDPETGYYHVQKHRQDLTPRRLRKNLEERNYEIAKRKAEHLYAKWLMKDPETGKTYRIKFGEVCDDFLEQVYARARLPEGHRKRLRPGTVTLAERYVGKELKEQFGHLFVDDISDRDGGEWSRWVDRKQAEYYRYMAAKERGDKGRKRAAKSLYSHWKHMCEVMQFARKKGFRTKEWEAENPDPKSGKQRKLQPEEVAAIVGASKGPMRAQILMAATMGLRLREVLRQQFMYSKHSPCPSEQDFCRTNMEARTVSVCSRHAKTKRSIRTVMLSPQAEDAIRDILAQRAVYKYRYVKRDHSPFLFPAPENPDTCQDQNKNAWAATKKRAGIVGAAKFHLLRHYYLSQAAKAVKQGDMALAEVTEYAGLTIRVFQEVYLQLDHRDTHKAARLVTIDLPGIPAKQEQAVEDKGARNDLGRL